MTGSDIFHFQMSDIGYDEHRDVPVEYQLPLLGLTKKTLKTLRDKRSLDVACGCGDLVEHMRSQGVLATGVDPRAPDKDYFTRRLVTGFGPQQGFPAEDGSLDLITSFQNVCLNTALGELRTTWVQKCSLSFQGRAEKIMQVEKERAQYMIAEAGRTLKPRGRFIIYPYLEFLEETAGHLLRMDRLTARQEPVKEVTDLVAYRLWEGDDDIDRKNYHQILSCGAYRLILTKS